MHRSSATVSTLGCALTLAAAVTAAELPFGSRITVDDTYLGPVSVTVADFDGDGLEDLVAAGIVDPSLAWWRNAGGGAFTRHQVVASATDISDVEAGDVNGDGWIDVIVTATDTTNAVAWYENDGTPTSGGWPLRLISYPFDGAVGTAVGDLDDTGTLDVVGVASAASQVAVALNTNGTGIGWSYEFVDTAFIGARWTAAGDLDGDGDLDVAAAAFTSGEVSWWSRDTGGGSWSEHAIAVIPHATVTELADMDSDGDLDVLGAAYEGAVRWWENDGTGGGWDEHSVGDPAGDTSAAYPVDLDRDGDLDVIYASQGVGGAGWFENTSGDAAGWAAHVVDHGLTGAMDVAAADLDADGDLDLVAVDALLNTVAVWRNLSIHRSASLPAASTIASPMGQVKDLRPADLDRDGDLDLVLADTDLGLVAWLENEAGDGSSWSLQPIASSFPALAVATGDLDRDGLPDVLGTATGAVRWWRSDGLGGWSENVIPSSHASDNAVAVADLDRDGDPDVVLASAFDGLDWQENLGSGGSWAEHIIGGGYVWDADSLAVADLDGDGDDDVAFSSLSTVEWIANNLTGSGTFGTEIEVAAGLTDPRSVTAGDIDGDGDLDLASLDQATGEVLWWSNEGGGGTTWGAPVVIAAGLPKPQIVRCADLDHDGDLDAVVTAEDQSLNVKWLGWFENASGDGSLWTPHPLADNVYRLLSLALADLDGDGDLDLAQGDTAADEVQLWLNLGGQAALITEPSAPPTLDPLTLGAVLEITAVHRGCVGDGDAEVASLELLLADGAGAPLTSADANALLFGIYVFEDDDDSGTFDPAFDTQVAVVDTFSLVDGVVTVGLPDGMENVRIAPDLPRTLFVAVAFDSGAASIAPDGIEVAHLTASSVVEDRDHDLPLTLEVQPEVASGLVVPTDPDLLFGDGFESGTTGEWSGAVP